MKTSFPKTVFFDASGTLCHLPRGVGAHYAEVLARHGVEREATVLEAAFRRAWKESPGPENCEGPRGDDNRGWWRALVTRVLGHGGVHFEPAAEDAFFGELYEEFVRPGVWELYPDVLPVLSALEGRCALGVITNFDGRFRAVARLLGIEHFFAHVVISSEVGADKPDPRIFQHALRQAGVAAEETLHVGDDPQCDWEGAAAAGLQAFWLRRPENSLYDLLTSLRLLSPS